MSTLTDTFTSRLYGYSINVDPTWTIATATVSEGAAIDDTPPDPIAVTGTDKTITGHAADLRGQPFDAWLADRHQEVLDNNSIPASCKGGHPTRGRRSKSAASPGFSSRCATSRRCSSPSTGRHTASRGAMTPFGTSEGSTPQTEVEIPAMTERRDFKGLSIGYQAGWTNTAGGFEWTKDGATAPSLQFYADRVELTGSETVAEAIAAAGLDGPHVSCAPVEDPPEITIGASRGYLLSSDCGIPGNRHHFLALLIAGDRGYTLHMDTTQANGRAWFDALLATVELEPDNP